MLRRGIAGDKDPAAVEHRDLMAAVGHKGLVENKGLAQDKSLAKCKPHHPIAVARDKDLMGDKTPNLAAAENTSSGSFL